MCESSEECVVGSEQGWCEPESACSFRDDGCKSERRYGALGPSDLAGRCVPREDAVEQYEEKAEQEGESSSGGEDPPAPEDGRSCTRNDDCLAGYCGPDDRCHLGWPGDPCERDQQCLIGRCIDAIACGG